MIYNCLVVTELLGRKYDWEWVKGEGKTKGPYWQSAQITILEYHSPQQHIEETTNHEGNLSRGRHCQALP